MDWEIFERAAEALAAAIQEARRVEPDSLDPDIQQVAAALRRLRGHGAKDVTMSCRWLASRLRITRRLAHA